jgi:hypothetical protein
LSGKNVTEDPLLNNHLPQKELVTEELSVPVFPNQLMVTSLEIWETMTGGSLKLTKMEIKNGLEIMVEPIMINAGQLCKMTMAHIWPLVVLTPTTAMFPLNHGEADFWLLKLDSLGNILF